MFNPQISLVCHISGNRPENPKLDLTLESAARGENKMSTHTIEVLSRAPKLLTLLAILAGSASCWMPFALPPAEPTFTPKP
jgi:hypothetical protein